MFTPNGTKKNFEQFAKDYAAKYNPSLLEGESSGYGEMGTVGLLTTAGAVGGGPFGAGVGFLGGLIASGLIDDVDDIYQDLDEKYRKTYNSDEVQGLKSGRGSLDDGITGIFSQNRIYSFDPAGKSALKDAVRDLYAKDIAPALKNPAAKGATFLEGNLMNLEADDEVGNNPNASRILSQILRSSFQTKWKESNDGRPLFDITRSGMVQGDPNKVGLTFTLSEDFIKKYKGTEKNKGITWGLEGNDISVIMDRDKVNSQFFKSTETSDLEFILNSTGQLDISSYSQYGGASSIKKSANGQYVIDHSLKYVDPESGQLMSVNQQYVEQDIDINYLYAQLSTDLQNNYESIVRQLRKKNGE